MPLNYHNDLTAEFVRSILDYDPSTGILRWKKQVRYGITAGKEAGWISNGYRVISINQRSYQAHRLAYLIMTGEWPLNEIDHRDLNPTNNVWDNLRPATRGQNQLNRFARRDNKSGFKGVSFCNTRMKWIAVLYVNGKSLWCGAHGSPELAYAAWKTKAALYDDEFRRVPT